jgi:transposase
MFLRPASTAGGGKRARIQHAPREERYPSDVTDAEWEIIAPMIPSQRQGGRRRETDMRDVMNAVRYVLRTGCQWRQLPKDFPPRSTVYNYFWEWTRYGVLDHIHHMLLVKVREAEGREASPTAAIIDTQAVKATEKGGLRGIRSPYRRSGRAWRQCRAARMRLLSSPAKAGEGTTRSVVEGARGSTPRFRLMTIVESDAPPTAQTRGPLPAIAGRDGVG